MDFKDRLDIVKLVIILNICFLVLYHAIFNWG